MLMTRLCRHCFDLAQLKKIKQKYTHPHVLVYVLAGANASNETALVS